MMISEMSAHEAFEVATKRNTFGESPDQGNVRVARAEAASMRMDQICNNYGLSLDDNNFVNFLFSTHDYDDLIAMLRWLKIRKKGETA